MWFELTFFTSIVQLPRIVVIWNRNWAIFLQKMAIVFPLLQFFSTEICLNWPPNLFASLSIPDAWHMLILRWHQWFLRAVYCESLAVFLSLWVRRWWWWWETTGNISPRDWFHIDSSNMLSLNEYAFEDLFSSCWLFL